MCYPAFWITSLLLKEKGATRENFSLRDFYVLRRAYRILPAAYLYMVVVTIVCWHRLPGTEIICAFTYLSNYVLHPHWILGHLWSLSVEEQFYLLWPFLIATYFNQRIAIVVAAMAVAPFFRIVVNVVPVLHAPIFPSVQDALATGCLLAMVWPMLDDWSAKIDRWIIPIAAATIALPVVWLPHGMRSLLADTLVNIGIALCIYHCVRKQYRFLNVAPVVWLGTLSYSFYLWQQPFLQGSNSPFTAFPLNVVCVLAVAAICHYGIERPFLKLRERRSRAAGVMASEVVVAA